MTKDGDLQLKIAPIKGGAEFFDVIRRFPLGPCFVFLGAIFPMFRVDGGG